MANSILPRLGVSCGGDAPRKGRTQNALTDVAIRNAKPGAKPIKLADGAGMFLLAPAGQGATYDKMASGGALLSAIFAVQTLHAQTAEQAAEIEAAGALDEKFRGAFSNYEQDCAARDAAFDRLEKQGWCWAYSDWQVLPTEYRWHPCSEARPEPVTVATYESAPSPQAKSAWSPWLIVFLVTAVYFLPLLVAQGRKHHNTAAIGMLNLLLGWTGIGWTIALIWAFTNRPPA